MSDFKFTVGHPVQYVEAKKAADAIEEEVGEIMNGLRKAGKITVENIAVLVTFVRQNEVM